MSYLSVPGTRASILDCGSRCRLLARSVGWRGKLRPAKSWSRACRKGGWIRLLFGQMPRPSTASRGVESWIASLRESRASLGATQGSSKDSRTTGTSASILSAPLARWDQASSSWRTSPGLFDSEPPTFSGDWPTSGTIRNGACFPLPESAPLISASESSCWRTPATSEVGVPLELLHSKDGGPPKAGERVYRTKNGKTVNQTVTLGMQAEKMWPTATAGDSGGLGERRLPSNGDAECGNDADGRGGEDCRLEDPHGEGLQEPGLAGEWELRAQEARGMDNRPEQPGGSMAPRGFPPGPSGDWSRVPKWLHPSLPGRNGAAQLNPCFVEWLMGLPPFWSLPYALKEHDPEARPAQVPQPESLPSLDRKSVV